MPSHVHLLVQSRPETTLQNIMRDFKKFLKQIVAHFRDSNEGMLEFFKMHNSSKQEYRVWDRGCHAIQVINHRMFLQKIRNIHYNPVRAGFVDQPVDWKYSSAGLSKLNAGGIELASEITFGRNTLMINS